MSLSCFQNIYILVPFIFPLALSVVVLSYFFFFFFLLNTKNSSEKDGDINSLINRPENSQTLPINFPI